MIKTKQHITLLFLSASLLCSNVLAQSTSFNTILGDKNIEINYKVNGQSGVIKALHQIPLYSYPITEALPEKQATDKNNFVKISTLNYGLLDSLVWLECNTYREEKKLTAVVWNDTIYKASKHHSEYQAYFNFIAHGESKILPNKSDEQKHYKKMYSFCAEICLMNTFTDGKTTYSELAKEMITQWKNSPGHNAIMISPTYKLNSFATAFRYNCLLLLTRENLLLYNPKLLTQIENVLPDYFERPINNLEITVWCTGNFTESAILKKKLELSEKPITTSNTNEGKQKQAITQNKKKKKHKRR